MTFQRTGNASVEQDNRSGVIMADEMKSTGADNNNASIRFDGYRSPRISETSSSLDLQVASIEVFEELPTGRRDMPRTWCANGVRQPQLTMAAVLGSTKTQMPQKKTTTNVTHYDIYDVPGPPNSTRLSLIRGRSRLPITLNCEPNRDAYMDKSMDAVPKSIIRFCDTYKWDSSRALQIHGAPDAYYKYTYGTADTERARLSTDVSLSGAKRPEHSAKQVGRSSAEVAWDASKHLETVTSPVINLPRFDTGNNSTGVASKDNHKPRSSSCAPLHDRVTNAVDLLSTFEKRTSSRPLSREMSGSLEYAYRRDRPRRDRITTTDFLHYSPSHCLRRSQTAPSGLRVNIKDKSADAYRQYVEQYQCQVKSRNSPSPSRGHREGLKSRRWRDATMSGISKSPPTTPHRQSPICVLDTRAITRPNITDCDDRIVSSHDGTEDSDKGDAINSTKRPVVRAALHRRSAKRSSKGKRTKTNSKEIRPNTKIDTNHNDKEMSTLPVNTQLTVDIPKTEFPTISSKEHKRNIVTPLDSPLQPETDSVQPRTEFLTVDMRSAMGEKVTDSVLLSYET